MKNASRTNRHEQRQSSVTANHLWFLCISGFLDLLGVSLVIPFLPKYIRSLGQSYTIAGIVGSIYGFLQFFSSPIVGHLSDLLGRKPILLLSLCCTGFSYLLMTTAYLPSSILVVAFSRIPPGLLKHSQALTRAQIARSTQTLAYFNAASTAGFILGPPLTGILIDRYSETLGYSIAGQLATFLFITNACLVYYAVPRSDGDSGNCRKHYSEIPATPKLEGIVETWLKMLHSTFALVRIVTLRYLYSAKLLHSMALLVARSAYFLYLEHQVELSSTVLGWVSAFSPTLAVFLAPTVSPICNLFENKAPRLQSICCILEVVAFSILLLSRNVYLVILSAIPHGIATAIGRVNYTSMALYFGGNTQIGALIGFDQSILAFSRTLAPAITGVLMDISMSLPFCLTIGLLLPTAVIFHHLQNLSKKEL